MTAAHNSYGIGSAVDNESLSNLSQLLTKSIAADLLTPFHKYNKIIDTIGNLSCFTAYLSWSNLLSCVQLDLKAACSISCVHFLTYIPGAVIYFIIIQL